MRLVFFVTLLEIALLSYNLFLNEAIPAADLEHRCIFWQYETDIKIKSHIYAIPRGHHGFYNVMKFHHPPQYTYFYHPNRQDVTKSENENAFRIHNHYLEAYRVYINGVGGFVFKNQFYTMKEHD